MGDGFDSDTSPAKRSGIGTSSMVTVTVTTGTRAWLDVEADS